MYSIKFVPNPIPRFIHHPKKTKLSYNNFNFFTPSGNPTVVNYPNPLSVFYHASYQPIPPLAALYKNIS